MNDNVRSLETHKLEWHRECREAALFAEGLKVLLGDQTIRFTYREEADYDVIISREVEGKMYVSPVQLKRLVPEELNPKADLNEIITKMRNLTDSRDLVVAIFICRNIELEIDSIIIPEDVQVREIYVFGATSEDQKEWFICGDLNHPERPLAKFKYPE